MVSIYKICVFRAPTILTGLRAHTKSPYFYAQGGAAGSGLSVSRSRYKRYALFVFGGEGGGGEVSRLNSCWTGCYKKVTLTLGRSYHKACAVLRGSSKENPLVSVYPTPQIPKFLICYSRQQPS